MHDCEEEKQYGLESFSPVGQSTVTRRNTLQILDRGENTDWIDVLGDIIIDVMMNLKIFSTIYQVQNDNLNIRPDLFCDSSVILSPVERGGVGQGGGEREGVRVRLGVGVR